MDASGLDITIHTMPFVGMAYQSHVRSKPPLVLGLLFAFSSSAFLAFAAKYMKPTYNGTTQTTTDRARYSMIRGYAPRQVTYIR